MSFISFMKLRGQLKTLKREKNMMVSNLNILHSVQMAGVNIASDTYSRRQYTSLLDGNEGTLIFSPPASRGQGIENTLIVYLHGMGSTYMEPFTTPVSAPVAPALQQKDTSCAVLSPDYRGTGSWGSEAATADITQNIRHVMQEYRFQRIILVGSSMGGCTALSYATMAPADIKSKITGIVAALPSGELSQLFKDTIKDEIRQALMLAFNGTPETVPETYRKHSLLANLSQLDPKIRVAIISATDDKVVPTRQQQDIVTRLQQAGFQSKIIPVEGGHETPPTDTFIEGFNFVTGKSS